MITIDEWLELADNNIELFGDDVLKNPLGRGLCHSLSCTICPFRNDSGDDQCWTKTDLSCFGSPNWRVAALRIYKREKLIKKLDLI